MFRRTEQTFNLSNVTPFRFWVGEKYPAYQEVQELKGVSGCSNVETERKFKLEKRLFLNFAMIMEYPTRRKYTKKKRKKYFQISC